MDARIQHIVEQWYINEPALFPVICTHDIEPNDSLPCPFRSGRGRVEYSPSLVARLSREQLELFLRAEAIRILLRHPYERQPSDCTRGSISLASNLVLADNYDFSAICYKKPAAYRLPEHQSYEWYAVHLDKTALPDCKVVLSVSSNGEGAAGSRGRNSRQAASSSNSKPVDAFNYEYVELKMYDGTSALVRVPKKPFGAQSGKRSGAGGGDVVSPLRRTGKVSPPAVAQELRFPAACDEHSQLWGEDVSMLCTLDLLVEDMTSWGTLPGDLVDRILANTKAKIDYRKVLTGFRASVLSSKRHLTRMRPNRRSGFDNMGSIRRFDTNLLIAVDVSASISEQTLCHFYSVINRMFKYGVEHVDVVQFDVRLGDVKGMEKRFKRIDVAGRGGTSFQPVFDYVVKHPEYDGLIIFTDGFAPLPQLSKRIRTKIVWVCDSRGNYEQHRSWMLTFGRCCPIEL